MRKHTLALLACDPVFLYTMLLPVCRPSASTVAMSCCRGGGRDGADSAPVSAQREVGSHDPTQMLLSPFRWYSVLS